MPSGAIEAGSKALVTERRTRGYGPVTYDSVGASATEGILRSVGHYPPACPLNLSPFVPFALPEP